jgi:hypothetical protein
MIKARTTPRVKGNCDGVIDRNDGAPFALAVNNPSSYAENYPDCMIELADINP